MAAGLCLQAGAQNWNVLEQVRGDRERLSGCEGPYRFETQALTPAPKGYKPFYISHYGRHGSRYAWDIGTYNIIRETLKAASEAQALTPRGTKLYSDFLVFSEEPMRNCGDLVEQGAVQQREIARIMTKNFPEVFARGGEVLACASTIQRAIVSMSAFCISLQKHAPKVNITCNSLHGNMPITSAPGATDSPDFIVREGDVFIPEAPRDFTRRTVDAEGILDRLFTSRHFLEERGGRDKFLRQLYVLWQGYHNYSDSDFLEDIFTPEEQVAMWEAENYDNYVKHSLYRYSQVDLLTDIVARADEAIAGSPYCAHLRFGHDSVVNGLCPLINLDGGATQPQKAEDVKYWFQNFETPMAANLQFVLYRHPRKAQILFKILRNGQEATLPQFTPVSGPYYDWDEFRSWAAELEAAHPVK